MNENPSFASARHYTTREAVWHATARSPGLTGHSADGPLREKVFKLAADFGAPKVVVDSPLAHGCA